MTWTSLKKPKLKTLWTLFLNLHIHLIIKSCSCSLPPGSGGRFSIFTKPHLRMESTFQIKGMNSSSNLNSKWYHLCLMVQISMHLYKNDRGQGGGIEPDHPLVPLPHAIAATGSYHKEHAVYHHQGDWDVYIVVRQELLVILIFVSNQYLFMFNVQLCNVQCTLAT